MNSEVPDEIWVSDGKGTGNCGIWSRYETPHIAAGRSGKITKSTRKTRFPRFKYVRADKAVPDVNNELLECLNDAINLWDAQNPLNPDDINKWREVSKKSKASIEYIADAIVKAIADILYLSSTYEKIGKFKGTIDDLTIVLNRLGLNDDDEASDE